MYMCIDIQIHGAHDLPDGARCLPRSRLCRDPGLGPKLGSWPEDGRKIM